MVCLFAGGIGTGANTKVAFAMHFRLFQMGFHPDDT
jgi:hypothetical protein